MMRTARGLDRDAALALEVHVVEQLLLHLARRDGAGELEKAVGQRRLAVVDVGNDREVADPGGYAHSRFERGSAALESDFPCYGRERKKSTDPSRRCGPPWGRPRHRARTLPHPWRRLRPARGGQQRVFSSSSAPQRGIDGTPDAVQRSACSIARGRRNLVFRMRDEIARAKPADVP